MILGGPSKIIFFQKWTHGGARFGKQCIKRGCQQLRSLFLFDVLPFFEKRQLCDFWLFHFNEITAAKINISFFLCADFLCSWAVLGAIWGASGVQRGSQNRAFGDQVGTRGSKMVFRRGVEQKNRKIRENRVPKLWLFERLKSWKSCSCVCAVHILLKRVVAEMITEKIRNESPNGSQNGPQIGPQGVLGWYFVILGCFFGMPFLLDF